MSSRSSVKKERKIGTNKSWYCTIFLISFSASNPKGISNDTHIPWFGYANENETVESWVMCFNLQNVWINLNYFFLFFFSSSKWRRRMIEIRRCGFFRLNSIEIIEKNSNFSLGCAKKKKFFKFIHTKLTSEKKLMWNSFACSQETKYKINVTFN